MSSRSVSPETPGSEQSMEDLCSMMTPTAPTQSDDDSGEHQESTQTRYIFNEPLMPFVPMGAGSGGHRTAQRTMDRQQELATIPEGYPMPTPQQQNYQRTFTFKNSFMPQGSRINPQLQTSASVRSAATLGPVVASASTEAAANLNDNPDYHTFRIWDRPHFDLIYRFDAGQRTILQTTDADTRSIFFILYKFSLNEPEQQRLLEGRGISQDAARTIYYRVCANLRVWSEWDALAFHWAWRQVNARQLQEVAQIMHNVHGTAIWPIEQLSRWEATVQPGRYATLVASFRN